MAFELLRQDPEPSFSERWHRVADKRPKVSPHAQVIRQQFGPEIAYVVEDPASGHYYRLTEAAYFFLGMLDGTRTVDEAWQAACAQLGDAAPTQRECVDLLAQLQKFGLLLGTDPLTPEILAERHRQSKSERFQKRTGKFIFFNVPLINPESWLERTKHLYKPLYSKVGLVLWLLLVGSALFAFLSNWRKLGDGFNDFLNPGNLVWLGVLFMFIRAIHELGHATACKAMGGRCTEIGVIMIGGVLPLPYCDATSAWRFPEVWRRVLVSAAGMMVELVVASIAVFVWLTVDPATLTHALAFNVIVISGVTTLIFNMNPLLRYDGYYILSDITGSPNLAHRAKEFWSYLLHRLAYGVKGLRAPRVRDRKEAWLLGVYGVMAPPYRILIGLSIVLLIASQYAALGIILAVVLISVMFVWPVLKGIGHLASSPKLVGRRVRAVGVCAAFLGLLFVLIGLIPVRAGATASGVLEPVNRAALRAGEGGFITEILARPGQDLRSGETVFVLRNAELVSEHEQTLARLERARLTYARATEKSPAEAEAALTQIRTLEERALQLADRIERLKVRSPIDGQFVALGGGGSSEHLVGRYVQRGTLMAMVMTADELVVRAEISDRERAYVFRGADEEIVTVPASIRVRGSAFDVIPARATSMAPTAAATVSNPTLTTRYGGDILLDPNDPEGVRTVHRFATVIVRPEAERDTLQPGQRVRVRFSAPEASIGRQVIRKARQYLSGRFGV